MVTSRSETSTLEARASTVTVSSIPRATLLQTGGTGLTLSEKVMQVVVSSELVRVA